MVKNYFKIALRNLWRNKSFSAINIFGLAIGMTSAILILLWIQNEMGMERFHEKGDRIYLMYNRDKDTEGSSRAWLATPKILAPTLKKDYPEVDDAVRYSNITFLITKGDKKMNNRGAFVDSGFLNTFSFPILKGNKAGALRDVHSIVLTETFAKALFGKEEAVGQNVLVDSVHNCTITGVLKDLPNNTTFQFDYLLPWSYMQKLYWDDDSWGNNTVTTYALLKPGTNEYAFDEKIKNITIDHTKESASPITTEVFTQPLHRSYLYAKIENGNLVGGQIDIVKYFGIIAGFILLIACINFMNLSTARSQKRAKEVGIRKVVGAQKKSLVLQFLGESILLSLLAFIVSLFLVQLSLSAFNQLVGKQLSIDYGEPLFWIFSILFILFTGILAGSYPAFYLSGFKPVKVLKGVLQKSNALIAPRKILVVVQFSFAIILIISTIIVVQQINYGLNREPGYDKDNLIYAFTQGDVDKNYTSIKNELISNQTALSVTQSANPITQSWFGDWGYEWKGSTKSDEKMSFLQMQSDANFTKTIGVKLLEGRDIDIYNFPTDSTAIVLNEAAVKAMRLKEPIGTIVRRTFDSAQFHVVGVMKDFVIESPFDQNITPLMLFSPGQMFAQILHIKLNPAKPTKTAIAEAEAIFKKYNPLYPFEYAFVDESYAAKFASAQRTSEFAALFAGLTIFISCLGLFGLATYMAENRIKEIGVRKVLGASVTGIAALLSKDFLKLVLISFLIAAPISWWAMSQWLESYTYRINISWQVYALAGIVSLLIAMLTVSYQAIKAAMANPVESLRTE